MEIVQSILNVLYEYQFSHKLLIYQFSDKPLYEILM